jgi:hypothetical protein
LGVSIGNHNLVGVDGVTLNNELLPGRVIPSDFARRTHDDLASVTFLLDAPAKVDTAFVPSYRARHEFSKADTAYRASAEMDTFLTGSAKPIWFYRRHGKELSSSNLVMKLDLHEPQRKSYCMFGLVAGQANFDNRCRERDHSVMDFFNSISPQGDYGKQLEPAFVTDPQGDDWFMGMRYESTSIQYPVLTESHVGSEDWASMFQNLVDIGRTDDALALASKLLNPYERAAEKWGTEEDRRNASRFPERFEWGDFDRHGVIGAIYPYANPYSKRLEFFRLVALGSDQRYWYFPIDQKDNAYWEYLGVELPSEAQALSPFKVWQSDEAGAVIGDVYVRVNSQLREAEYFKLEKLNADGRYGPLPTNRTNDGHWTYLGTDLPIPAIP